MSEDRKIITWEQMVDIYDDIMGAWDTKKWSDLPDYEAIAIQDELKLDLQIAEARIKELEAKLDGTQNKLKPKECDKKWVSE